jgi:hypothetical protein
MGLGDIFGHKFLRPSIRWIYSRGGFNRDDIKKDAIDAHDGSLED